MRTADMIKSKYFRAKDLEGMPPLTLTISDVTEELIGRGGHQDVRVFLWFHEHAKGLRLNKTSVTTLELAYGPESDAWSGKRVRLIFDPRIEFGGRPVGGVAIQTPPGAVFQANGHPGWGQPAPGTVPGRPPPPVWDEASGTWITQPAQPAKRRPPPPVFNEATGEWETVHPSTGEIAPPRHVPPKTIKERIDAGHPPAAAAPVDDWGPLPPIAAGGDDDPEFGHPDIPF